MFRPEINLKLHIRERVFSMAEHPTFPGVPYGQEGRQGTVYKLLSEDGGQDVAMKVFRPSFRHPSLIRTSEKMLGISGFRGLRVCDRQVLSPQLEMELLSQYPELLYSVIMPWIDGDTWCEVIQERRELQEEQCRHLAISFAGILADMEQRGLAHTDLSSSNLMISGYQAEDLSEVRIELLDLEDLYMAGIEEPDHLPEGINGYMAQYVRKDLVWGPDSDRFAGGILIAEMLAWSSPEIRNLSWGDSYFDPDELQQECNRFELMQQTIEKLYGYEAAGLFVRLWRSEQLQQCPSFGEWLIALSSIDSVVELDQPVEEPREDVVDEVQGSEKLEAIQVNPFPDDKLKESLQKARELEGRGQLTAALWEYGKLISYFPEASSLRREIEMVMSSVQQSIDESLEAEVKDTLKVRDMLRKEQITEPENLYRNVWMVTLILSVVFILISLTIYIFKNI